jgi:hypothetical protein
MIGYTVQYSMTFDETVLDMLCKDTIENKSRMGGACSTYEMDETRIQCSQKS